MKADVLYELGRYEEALNVYVKLHKQTPKDANTLADVAFCLTELRRFPEALESCKRALDLDPECVNAHLALGDVHSSKREYELALAANRKAAELDPRRACAYGNIAASLNNLRRYEEAIPFAKKAIEIDPEFADPYGVLAYSLNGLKRYEEAEDAAKKGVALKWGAFRVGELAQALIGQQRSDEARRLLADSKNRLDEFETRHMVTHAKLYAELGERRDAVELLEKAVGKLPPKPADSDRSELLSIAVGQYRLGEVEKALKTMSKAVEAFPGDCVGQNNLGFLLMMVGDLDHAVPHLIRAAELDSKYSRAYFNLGAYYFAVGDAQKGAANYEKGIGLDSGEIEDHLGDLQQVKSRHPDWKWVTEAENFIHSKCA